MSAERPLFYREADFRDWLEENLDRFDIKRVILSQGPCPDYVMEMRDGRILRVEAELFAVNFRYHRHDPSKVDLIIACYTKKSDELGVPVVALHELSVWERTDAAKPIPADQPLSEVELRVLRTINGMGSVALSALGNIATHLTGDRDIWLRFSPDAVGAIPRGRDDSVMSLMSPETKDFIRKYHHALIGTGLSQDACDAIESLYQRELVRYRPIEFLAAAMDGGIVDHPSWLPTEIALTEKARTQYRDLLRGPFV